MSLSPDSNDAMTPSHLSLWVIALVAMIYAIIVVFSYFRIGVQLCCLFQRITFSRNRVLRWLLDGSNADDPSLQFYSHGLDFSTIHSIPFLSPSSRKRVKEKRTRRGVQIVRCAWGNSRKESGLDICLRCSHSFHISCIDTWLLNHSNCPLCRIEVLSPELEDLESPVSVYSLPPTLRRVDFFRERAAHYQLLRSEILQDLVGRRDTMAEN